MKIRQYDQLMEMDYEEDYIDPVTGLNKKQDFQRNMEIYKENIKDTSNPVL